jgi:hypothetical protein
MTNSNPIKSDLQVSDIRDCAWPHMQDSEFTTLNRESCLYMWLALDTVELLLLTLVYVIFYNSCKQEQKPAALIINLHLSLQCSTLAEKRSLK